MITIYCQTIETASDQHALWYSNFASAFLFCQLTNRLLLSYMENYVREVTQEEWLETEEFKGLAQEIPLRDKHELACDLDIEDFLQQIINDFPDAANRQKAFLMAMGLKLSGFHDDSTSINLITLKIMSLT
jgi:hypothetical protein